MSSLDAEAGTIELENGEVISADMVLGADGIHVQCPLCPYISRDMLTCDQSALRCFVTGNSEQPSPTGKSCWRILVPLENAKGHKLDKFVGRPGELTVTDDGKGKTLITYPCRYVATARASKCEIYP